MSMSGSSYCDSEGLERADSYSAHHHYDFDTDSIRPRRHSLLIGLFGGDFGVLMPIL